MIKFLTLKQVIGMHDLVLKEHGGLAGIRDRAALESAIEMPKAQFFGEELHKSIYEKAAAYLFHIVQNHPFNDANKRTGSLTATYFLKINGIVIRFSKDDYLEFVREVAKGNKNKLEIAAFLESG